MPRTAYGVTRIACFQHAAVKHYPHPPSDEGVKNKAGAKRNANRAEGTPLYGEGMATCGGSAGLADSEMVVKCDCSWLL
ncbi:MAG: hypothetical protein J5644_08975 [Bacteroidales bacterium]|nr:hypothetical protein [Bacteroidales bacterium]